MVASMHAPEPGTHHDLDAVGDGEHTGLAVAHVERQVLARESGTETGADELHGLLEPIGDAHAHVACQRPAWIERGGKPLPGMLPLACPQAGWGLMGWAAASAASGRAPHLVRPHCAIAMRVSSALVTLIMPSLLCDGRGGARAN